MVTTGKKEPPHGYPRTTLKSHINFSNTSSVFSTKAPLASSGIASRGSVKKSLSNHDNDDGNNKMKSNGFNRQNIKL